jgi:mRNA interferase RelE/StbE
MTAGWDWTLSDSATDELASLDPETQERILTKLDEVVDDQWREPAAFLEPLRGGSHSKLRVGSYRLGCRLDRERKLLLVGRNAKRGDDAYRSDD